MISIEQQLTTFEYTENLTIWFDVLSEVNFAGKMLYSPIRHIN